MERKFIAKATIEEVRGISKKTGREYVAYAIFYEDATGKEKMVFVNDPKIKTDMYYVRYMIE